MLRGWCIFVMFMALSGTAWVHAFGELTAAVVTIAGGILSVILWILIRPPVAWRRLPWFVVAFVALATLSLLWSAWPQTTALTLLLLWITTTQALFVGSVLTWRELVRAAASALKWVIALSILFELWVSVFVQAPILPGFEVAPADDPIEYWSRNNLFDGGRLQGIIIFTALGRSADLTGREAIWKAVLTRAAERPWFGWGYATPWVPWDPAFDGWIPDHGQTVLQAHNMWVDIRMQLGIVGVVITALVYLAFVWRSWFFAVDRPRWDLRDDRPYSAITLLPTLVGAIVLVQGLAESTPLLLWGWMFVVMLGAKITQSPHVGEGPAEHSIVPGS
ncbi:O-antigen ligase family protein [Microbacterium sp. SSM24]|uniref:O-antigen ligase family protein n=1 Tax=Microbacterium sp. SSM24 TaxID=2991714 RepID=UPI002227C57F|nr:O-antigen ligase family protein [Microbacterium sp. SSM24]MCW3492921.1 O-antigen ligase family protein [Microbacterium sp. SSM24]